MSFTTTVRQRSSPMLPLAGMVDILFLLLIFFMTISAFREYDQQIDVSLPATEVGETDDTPTQIVITITKDDEVYLGEKQYTHEQLEKTLGGLAESFPDESVFIRGDRASRLNTAVQVMDSAYKAGLHNVFIATAQPEVQ